MKLRAAKKFERCEKKGDMDCGAEPLLGLGG